MVRVAHVRVGQDDDALGERDLIAQRDRRGHVEEAFVADEAVTSQAQVAETPAIEIEQTQVHDDRVSSDRGARQAESERAQRRYEQQRVDERVCRHPQDVADASPESDGPERLHGIFRLKAEATGC